LQGWVREALRLSGAKRKRGERDRGVDRKKRRLDYGGEGKLDPVQTIAFFAIATAAGFAGYYVPLHFNALLSLLAYGIADAQVATVFVFCLTFSCLACSLLSARQGKQNRDLEIAIAGGYAVCAAAVPFLFLAVPAIFSAIRPLLWLGLLLLCAMLVLRDNNKKAAALVMAASGALGFLVLFFGLCDNALLALFTGFFGLSWDAQQVQERQGLGWPVLFVPLVGMLLVMLPAATPFLAQPVLSAALPLAGAGQSAALVVGKSLYDLCSAFAIGKARSQGSAMLAEAGADVPSVFLGIALGFVSLLCAIAFCKVAPVPGNRTRKAVEAVGKAVLAGLVLFSCGPWGLVVAIAAAAMSEYASESGTHGGMCLGCLYCPAIIYPLGLAPLLARVALGY